MRDCRCLLLLLALATPAAGAGPPAPWPAEVRQALAQAGDNRAELARALERVPEKQRPGLTFLVANMPARDLRSLSAAFLLENVALAYKARAELPWGREVPEAVFLNDVLPYANLDEERHPWRKELYELCLPLVKGCRTPGEAAVKLNSTLFGKLKVRYSTKRKKANQSPKESIETGLASCSGLSVLLADACRSVCVPARLAGTPMWHNNRGNHTWVEVWDGRWRFTGAAEPAALDSGWFVGDAARATKGDPKYAIFAASFRRTKTHFPLVWAPRVRDVFAEDVTDRYTAKRSPATDRVRVQVRVRVAGTRDRVALPVVIEERRENCEVCRDRSRGESSDTNDLLTVELLPDRDYVVRVGTPALAERPFRTAAGQALLLDVDVPKPLTADESRTLEKALREYFEAKPEKRAKWVFDKKLEALLAQNEPAARAAAWKAYRDADIHQELEKDFAAKQVRYEKHTAPYTVKKVGKKPTAGWPLFIAMHGGGGAPQAVNDSQWKVMQRYYKDQEGLGYTYVALRAPNNTWNGFYDSYVPPLVINLIRQFTLFGEVDPNKVYIMGYSHGGYGAFYIGPRIPDRFAAVHASAAAPSDANSIARNLRNTVFTFMIGEKDTAYGRIKRCEAFGEEVEKLKKAHPGAYPVTMELKKGFGHGGLPDRDKIKEMIAHRRAVAPKRVTWEVSGGPTDRFYWLGVPKAEGGAVIDAAIDGQTITVTATKGPRVELALDRRLVSFDRPLTVVVNGKKREVKAAPSLLALCRTMAERGDPELAATCVVPVEVGEK